MATLTRVLPRAAAARARLDTARDGLVVEAPDGPGAFRLERGPFTHYRRTVVAAGDEVRETVEYRLAPAVLPPISWLYRAGLRRHRGPGWRPW